MPEAINEPSIVFPFEDGISNRERRALRGPSPRDRRAAARSAQIASGVRIRLARKVMNQLDFREQRKKWYPAVQEGTATSKSIGSFALTVFDTAQQPLRFGEEHTKESVEERIRARYPDFFLPSPPIEVTGTALFGNRDKPFIALTLAPGHAYDEKVKTRDLIAPELWLDNSHQLDDVPHISLGQVFARSKAEEIRIMLAPVLPAYVQFMPGIVNVERK